MNQKIRICDNICYRLNITGTSRDRCINIVKNVSLKDLHRTASCETIIACICFYVKKSDFPSVRINEYSVCKECKVTESAYMLIITRLCDFYQKNSYL